MKVKALAKLLDTCTTLRRYININAAHNQVMPKNNFDKADENGLRGDHYLFANDNLKPRGQKAQSSIYTARAVYFLAKVS